MKTLNKKDLINIGIFNAVAIALYLAVGVATSVIPVLHIFAVQPIAALISGAIYLLMVTKINKKGVFLISGIVQGIVFSLLLGLYASILIIPLFGFFADLICGNYSAKKMIVSAYAIFMLGVYYGQIFFMLFFTKHYLSFFSGNMLAHKQSAADSITGPIVVLITVIIIAAGAIGGALGCRILKKHFVKAGIVA